MTQPTRFLQWTDGAADQVQDPPQSVHRTGFSAGAPLPAVWLNHNFWLLDGWVQHLAATAAGESLATSLGESMRLLGGGQLSYSLATRALTWSEPLFLSFPSVPDADNRIEAGQVTLGDGQVAYVNSAMPYSTTCDLNAGEDTLTHVAYTLGVQVGATASGHGIPKGTTVQAIDGDTVTLSQAVTATAAQQNVTFATVGTLTIQVADVASLVPASNTVILARGTATSAHVGVLGGIAVYRDNERKALFGSGYLAVVRAPLGQSAPQRACMYISPGAGDTSSGAGDVTSGSKTIANLSATNELGVGMGVSGAGIPTGTTIAALDATSLTLSNAATQTSTAAALVYTRVAGAAYLAHASQVFGAKRSSPLGFAISAVSAVGSAPQGVSIMTGGSLAGFTGLVPGTVYYLDPVLPGNITAARPAKGNYIVVAGVATAPDTLYVTQWFGTQLDLDGVYNDVVVKPIVGAANSVGYKVLDSNNKAVFSVDPIGITTAAQVLSGNGTAQYPAVTYTNQADTGSYLANQSLTAAAIAWATNGIRRLLLSNTALTSTVQINAPSYSTQAGFKMLLEAGKYYAAADSTGAGSAPTNYTKLVTPIVGPGNIGTQNMLSDWLPTHSGSVVGASLYLNGTLASGITCSLQVITDNGINGTTSWTSHNAVTQGGAVAQAKGPSYFFNGSIVYCLIKFSSAAAVTRARVVLTLEMDG
ncbi:MAG: hypothetical protein EOO40_00830 [Deltaproteobacteria bacterium]|nr:MAG: hypothetical protein EOO40_00830 [Deltaproteobacteria bacterium]